MLQTVPVCAGKEAIGKTKIAFLIEFIFLASTILNSMVRLRLVEMVRFEQRDEEGEGNRYLGRRVFRPRSQLVTRLSGTLQIYLTGEERASEVVRGSEAKMVGRSQSR